MGSSYLRRVYEVPAGEAELLLAALAEAGTLGVEELADGGLAAWFPSDGAPFATPAGARLVAETVIEEEDWLAPYRAVARPLAVGTRLLIDPREPCEAAPEAAGRLLLRIPARSAFGTGSHASTRLALRLLERLPLFGARLLDVGAGSGVLAIAALALGAAGATGFDVDPAAALLAGQHARLNRLPATFWAGGTPSLDAGARFDVVVVNALPHEVLPEAAAIAGAVATEGRLVVSGVLASEGEAALGAWAARGLSPVDTLAEEEWVAWTLSR